MFLLGPVERSPHGRPDKQSHGLDVIRFVTRESMVTSFRQCHQIALFDVNANPLVLLVTDVKVSTAIDNVTDFFGVVDVFLKESLDFFVVSWQQIGFDGNDIGVRVSAYVYRYIN